MYKEFNLNDWLNEIEEHQERVNNERRSSYLSFEEIENIIESYVL